MENEIGVRGKYAYSFPELGSVEIIKDPLIIVENDKIVSIGPYDQTKSSLAGHDIVGDKDADVLIPGLINTHTHAAMTLFRGIADDLPLMEWLEKYIWPMESHLTPDDIFHGARLAVLEMLRSGTTTANSMYWHPEKEAQAFVELGMRAIVGYPILHPIAEYKRDDMFVVKWHQSHNDLIRVALQPHAPYTVTNETYQVMHELLLEYNEKFEVPVLFHTHLAETKHEMEAIRNFAQEMDFQISEEITTPTQYLDSLGVLDQYTVAAHCVHTSKKDVETLRSRKVGVSINLVSNLKLASGIPPLVEYVSNNVKTSLGTDGASSNNRLDLFETTRLIALLYKGLHYSPTLLPISEAMYLATAGGANVLHMNNVGQLKEGFKADIVSLSLKTIEMQPIYHEKSALSHLVYIGERSHVKNVIVNGSLVIENTLPTKVAIDEILDSFKRTSTSLFERI